MLTVKGSQWVGKGKCHASSPEGQEKYWRAIGWLASPWFPRRSWIIPRIMTYSLGRNLQKCQRQEDDWKQLAKIQQGQRFHLCEILWLDDWVNEEGPMDVIFLDLTRALDLTSHSCGMLLGKRKRVWMVMPRCWCKVCGFLVALLRALYCNHGYLTPSSTMRRMGWTTTRAVVTDDTKLWGTAIQSILIKLEKWAARDIVESDKDKLKINYMELINLMQQDCQVCRNRPENAGRQQVWVGSAPFWLVPYQSALGDCNQR